MKRASYLAAVAAAAIAQAAMAQDTAPDPGADVRPFQDSGPQSPAPPVETLQQALAMVYRTNPTLMAERAEVRRVDSGVALARAAGRPQISTSTNFDQDVYTTRRTGSRGRGVSAGVQVEQILFAGGQIRNTVQAAETRVVAGRADLRETEGDLFTEAVAAYADVIRDRDIRDLTLGQVEVLEVNLDTTRSRFLVRDLTRADVSQSEARLAVARSSLAAAEGRLRFAEENFERVVGARAGQLEPLPPPPTLPATDDQALEIALENNAGVAAFVARARAAGYDVAATRGERLPRISAVSSTAYSNALGTADEEFGVPEGTLPNSSTDVAAGFSLRLPLFQGGAASARVRQAEASRALAIEQAVAIERLVVAEARANFTIWRSALTAIAANEEAVVSNEVALESVKVEQTVGARSILDVLNAEQELLASRIALASARRDAYVAAFALLNTMGAAEAADLNFEVGPLYDPLANYSKYARTWSDWADGPAGLPESTRTAPEGLASPLDPLPTAD